jgi:hypothetical protein
MTREALNLGVCLRLVVGATLFLAFPAPVSAVVSDVHLIDGPSSDLVGEVDAAMSEDGTGGVVYTKNVGGRAQVFVAPFLDGVWRRPQRVDDGQDFDSSWPRIAAGDDGRLLVTWVEDFGIQTDRIYSATLDPGGVGFREPVPVDFDVGNATSTYPDLTMARGGQAYIAYNVVTDTSPSNPPGYVGMDVRVSRYSNRLWTAVGSRIDRNSSIPMREPADGIGPKIGIDIQGQAVVAWLEPDDDFVDRVWARRVFGGQTGIPIQVSPSVWEEKPLRGGVTAFDLDVAGFGQASVAFRQLPGQASALDAPRIMAAGTPDVFTQGANKFSPAVLADGEARGGVGAPAAAVDPVGIFSAVFGGGSATFLGNGDEFSAYGTTRIDGGASAATPEPRVDSAETGAAVVAWRELRENSGVLAIQERRADGVAESTTLSAPGGGQVAPPALGGSGLGDAVVGFAQGTGSARKIAATVVDAPPDPFLVLVPQGWQSHEKIPLAWDPSPNAIGDVTYSVSVDDEPVKEGITDHETKLGRNQIGDGKHRIQIFAVDEIGQETGSSTAPVQVDRRRPEVKVRGGRTAQLRVTEGSGGSGLRGVEVSWGDGTKNRLKSKSGSEARDRHRYDRPGRYLVKVTAGDAAGNVTTKRVRVRAR